MAEGLILEFDGVGVDEYYAVNAALGLNQETGEGFPAGLIFHAGGAKPGGWVVYEVWDSQASQASFMAERLASALQEGGISGPPTRVEWIDLASYAGPGM